MVSRRPAAPKQVAAMNETARKGMRLADGGQIDRSKPLQFTFNGKRCTGYEGDTLASALLANGIRVVARSFKYHRPRGIFSAGEEEPCALVETGVGARRTPTCRAPLVRLHEGLVANSQNCWPGVTLDAGRMADFTHALWPAGFYNKTFKWPSWHAWEGLIRRSAGLGRPLTDKDPDRYEQVNAHCDLLICGAGPAGLVAAQTAGRAGLRVLLVDQDAGGGSLNWEQYRIGGQSAMSWVEQTLSELASMPNVQFLPFTTVSGIYDQNVTTLLQSGAGRSWRECLWTVRPRRSSRG
jgi:sarcosine oxidase subunit alpha